MSPISPQELFLQPISSDVEASQQENPVRENRCEQTRTTIINGSHDAGLLLVLVNTTYENIVSHCKMRMCCGIFNIFQRLG